ncbi:MAG: helix-turn-helix transcriptional regulator [Gammaproteobacteria bacterium]|nr:helix-turn-helix transcriptional regulator [Gammaproteobacteria bacterium]
MTMILSRQTEKFLENLGERIRQARIEANMSQIDLGDRIGVTRYTVGALESGRAKVAIGTVLEAAHVVGLPLFETRSDDLARSLVENNLPKRVKLDDDF